MSIFRPPAADLSFGGFRFDRQRLQLTRAGVPVPISGLPLRILEILLGSQGRLVTRTEFKQALWPHAIRIDIERRLNTAIRALREALGDTAREPLFIETHRGRGYRWIAPQHAPSRGVPGWRRAHFALALLLTLAGSGMQVTVSPEPSPEQQSRLVALAAAAREDRAVAQMGLDSLIRERPDFRAAHALRAQLAIEDWSRRPGPLSLARARTVLAAAARAIGPDPVLSTLSAELALAGDWDWTGAERLYRAALRQDPGNIAARRGLAWLYVNAGRRDEAWAEMGGLVASVPPTVEARADLGWLLLRMDRPELAASLCREDQARHINLLACRHTALARIGAIGPARDAAVLLLETLSAVPSVIASVRDAAPADGYRRFLDWRAEHFLPQGGHWFQLAQVQADANRFDAALDSLEQAFAARDPLIVKLGSTREFEPISRSPRYRALLTAIRIRTG